MNGGGVRGRQVVGANLVWGKKRTMAERKTGKDLSGTSKLL